MRAVDAFLCSNWPYSAYDLVVSFMDGGVALRERVHWVCTVEFSRINCYSIDCIYSL